MMGTLDMRSLLTSLGVGGKTDKVGIWRWYCRFSWDFMILKFCFRYSLKSLVVRHLVLHGHDGIYDVDDEITVENNELM